MSVTETKMCPYNKKECGDWCRFLRRDKSCQFVEIEEFILMLQFRNKEKES